MKSVEVSPLVADIARWLEEAMNRTEYGELVATVKLHKGRVPILNLTETRSIKTDEPHSAGTTGGRHEHRNK